MKGWRHVRGSQREGGAWSPTPHHRGRPASWIAVGILVVGMVTVGVSLTQGPAWPVLWVGVAVLGVGGVLALTVDLMGDVVLDKPRLLPESTHPGNADDPGLDEVREREDETPPGRRPPPRSQGEAE